MHAFSSYLRLLYCQISLSIIKPPLMYKSLDSRGVKASDCYSLFLKTLGSIPGRDKVIFYVSIAYYFFLFDYDFSLYPKVLLLLIKFLKIFGNDKSNDSRRSPIQFSKLKTAIF